MKKIAGIGAVLVGLLISISGIFLKVARGKSIEVIGGADGPTSVFLAGKVGGASDIFGIISGIVIGIVGICLIIRHKK